VKGITDRALEAEYFAVHPMGQSEITNQPLNRNAVAQMIKKRVGQSAVATPDFRRARIPILARIIFTWRFSGHFPPFPEEI
jgi:hypothetical protein